MESLTNTRSWNRIRPEHFGIIKPNLVLTVLPISISLFLYHHAAALVISSIILASFFSKKDISGQLRPTWPCVILPVGALIINLRPNLPNTKIEVLFFIMVLIATMRGIYTSSSKASALVSLHDGVGILIVASVLLWLSGFGSGGSYGFGKNVITGGERILFPLTSTLAIAPTIAAAYIVTTPMIMKATRRYRVFRVAALLAAGCILVQSDRRSALFAVAFIAIVTVAAPRTFRRLAPWVIGVVLTSPILVAVIPAAGGLSFLVSGLLTPLQRTNEDISTLNGRSNIWTRSLEFYEDRIDFLHQTFGYGTSGQVESGASSAYASMFSGLGRERYSTSPHSTVLQVLFDGGWVTAISFTVLLICAALVMARGVSPLGLAGLSMLTAMSFVGATENTLAPYLTAIPFWMTAVIVTVAFSREPPPPKTHENLRNKQHFNGVGAHRERQGIHEVS